MNKRKTAIATTYLTIDVDCPYCDEYIDIRDQGSEYLHYGKLYAKDIYLEVTCVHCKKEFVVTDIEY